jgi:hydrogenase-4 component F
MIEVFLIVTIVLAVVTYFIRNITLSHTMVFGYFLFLTVLWAYKWQHVGEKTSEYFMSDYLGIIFLSILIVISFSSALHYITFASSRQVPSSDVALHNGGTIFFTGAMTGVLFSAHFGVLWAFVEATTIGASILIYHNRNHDSLEATWKYLFVCSIGVAIAFAGILFLGLASQARGSADITYVGIKTIAIDMNPNWLKACFLLVVTGFSVKMGLVPLFNVDIDAKDASPSQVGASLSSVLMNAGFVSIYRFYDAFSGTSILHWMNTFLIITGVLSLFFASVYTLKVRNIKRLFAYSSMEHAGIVIIAFGCGGIGYFAAVLHLIMHSLTKSSLFFQVSQMHRIYDTKWDEGIGSYLKINPIGGLVLLLGFISIIALPPSGLFISELMMVQALITNNLWWLAVIIIGLVLVIIYGLATRMLGILFINKHNENINRHGATVWESVVQLSLILLVFYIGLFRPQAIVDTINLAIQTLPH